MRCRLNVSPKCWNDEMGMGGEKGAEGKREARDSGEHCGEEEQMK